MFRAKFDLSGLLARLGIGVDARGFGQNAGIGAWTRGYTPEERAAALAGIEASYALFVEAVGAARGMSAVEVDAVARGRVWAGRGRCGWGWWIATGALRGDGVRARGGGADGGRG